MTAIFDYLNIETSSKYMKTCSRDCNIWLFEHENVIKIHKNFEKLEKFLKLFTKYLETFNNYICPV